MLQAVSRITACEDITLITLRAESPDRNYVPSILTALARKGINVDMISQSAVQGGSVDFSFTLSDEFMQKAILLIRGLEIGTPHSQCTVTSGNCKLSFYGDLMQTTPGTAARRIPRSRSPSRPWRAASSSSSIASSSSVRPSVGSPSAA
jgi:aspartate kinase